MKTLMRTLAVVCGLLAATDAQTPVLLSPTASWGCSLSITLQGEPHAPFLLAADIGPGPVPLPGVGTVELDLSPALYVVVDGLTQGVAFDASGQYELEIPLPASSSGPLLLFLQAAVFGSGGLQLSNGSTISIVNPNPASFVDASANLPALDDLEEECVAVDVDADGDLDLVIAVSSQASGAVAQSRLLINQGGASGGTEGNFADESFRLGGGGIPALCVAAGDADGDGDVDLFFGADDVGVNQANVLLRNDGSGSFALDATFPGGAHETQSATFADLDGDGDLELVLGNGVDAVGAPQPNEILVNLGNALFITDPHFATATFNIPGETDDVKAIDVNGDGFLDLVFARDGQNQLLVNGGLGNFSEVALPVIADNSTDVSPGDFDGDGAMDFVISNIGQPDGLYLNDGIGNFTLTSLPGAPTTSLHLCSTAGDLDNDGDVDVVVGVHSFGSGEQSFIYWNQGGIQGGVPGSFASSLISLSHPDIIAGVVIADLDGNGSPDLYIANQGFFGPTAPDQLLLNAVCP